MAQCHNLAVERIVDVDEVSKKTSIRGRKQKYDPDALGEEVKQIEPKKRKTYLGLSKQMGIPRSTLYDYQKRYTAIIRHVNHLEPTLTDDHRIACIDYCLAMRGEDKTKYQTMYNMLHVHEKWFWITKDKEVYILAKGGRTTKEECETQELFAEGNVPLCPSQAQDGQWHLLGWKDWSVAHWT